MANFKEYKIGQSLNLHIDFDEFLPAHHFSRKIEQIVSELDIESILQSYSQEGQKAYNPQMLLSIIFYGYMIGIRSGRKLETACRTDLVFIYLSKCYRLSKSTINDFSLNEDISELEKEVIDNSTADLLSQLKKKSTRRKKLTNFC